MKHPHKSVIKNALLWATKRGWRLAQNVVGGGWIGTLGEEYMYSTKKGPRKSVELYNARFIKFGLLIPSSERGKIHGGTLDLVGWRTVVITPEMVGKKIAQYLEFDAKTPGYDRMSPDQKNRVKQILSAGGMTGIFRKNGEEEIELEVISDLDMEVEK